LFLLGFTVKKYPEQTVNLQRTPCGDVKMKRAAEQIAEGLKEAIERVRGGEFDPPKPCPNRVERSYRNSLKLAEEYGKPEGEL
jgi:hypothetical protein